MLENLSAQVISGVLAFSMMLFSNFKGNSPEFKELNLSMSSSYLYLNAELISAFENDFPVLFSSGTEIPIHFKVNIKSHGKQVYLRKLSHKVSFDTISGVYTLEKSSTENKFHTRSMDELIREVGRVKLSIPYQESWGMISVELEASLPRMSLDEADREVDLMALWRFKKPKIKTRLKINSIEKYKRSAKLELYEDIPALLKAG
jgi:hypothetical protein